MYNYISLLLCNYQELEMGNRFEKKDLRLKGVISDCLSMPYLTKNHLNLYKNDFFKIITRFVCFFYQSHYANLIILLLDRSEISIRLIYKKLLLNKPPSLLSKKHAFFPEGMNAVPDFESRQRSA